MTFCIYIPCCLFCRYNLYLKNLIRNGKLADIHLANSVAIDIAAGYMNLLRAGIHYDITKANVHNCYLEQRLRDVAISRREVGDLRMRGLGVDAMDVDAYAVAYILGTHFRAGRWGGRQHNSRTCSSVFTCVVAGRSLYGYVRKFLKTDSGDCPGYASVGWFGRPMYPCGSNRLEVVVSRDGSEIYREIGSCIIPITLIDPSMVVVEPDGVNLRVMRMSGYDTVRS